MAVARDAAFAFIYPANLQTLEQLGARLAFFSPLDGEGLPACDAVWLPGGYPELHAERLVANARLRADLHAHVGAGKPLWAECGGMMALAESITLQDGRVQPLWGLLPGRVTVQKRLAGLGPQQLDLPQGQLRGHTFHYSSFDCAAAVATRTARPGARVLFRTADVPTLLPGKLDEGLLKQWRYEEALSRALTRRDRSAIYGGAHVYALKRA